MKFVLNQPVPFEESLTCEFKEVKSQPVQAISKVVDEYVVAFLNEAGGSIYWGIRDDDRVVTGVPVTNKIRDELKQVIGQKVAAIAPAIPPGLVEAPFHAVSSVDGSVVRETCVVEVRVVPPQAPGLFLTGSGEAFRRTLGGTKKLSGAELFMALALPLQAKVPATSESVLARFPALHRRAVLVQSLVRGRRVLWIDDHPSNNFYERLALAQMGLSVDIAASTEEGIQSARHIQHNVIVSDMSRGGQQNAGLEFLTAARTQGMLTPIIFYVRHLDWERGVPTGAFGITDRPDEVLHMVLDVLERQAC